MSLVLVIDHLILLMSFKKHSFFFFFVFIENNILLTTKTLNKESLNSICINSIQGMMFSVANPAPMLCDANDKQGKLHINL